MTLAPASVVLDAQGAQNPSHRDRGIARYTVEQIAGVLELQPHAVRAIALSRDLPLPGGLHRFLGTNLLRWTDPSKRPPEGPPSIWHVTSPFELDQDVGQLWPSWVRTRDTRLVVTLYDLIPLIFADHYLREPQLRTRYMARANLLRAAHHVLAISQTTAADAVEHLGVDEDRITVIDAGVSPSFTETHLSNEAAWSSLATRLPSLREGFMLYVGGIEFRKNIERLIEGYALVPPEVRRHHQLVIACRIIDQDRARLEALAHRHGVRPDELILTGYVTDGELAALYTLCRLFVFASIYEGSGLPILEAMSCGAPVAASRASTSPEILGDLEGTFDPYDPHDIASVLAAIVDDEQALERLRVRSERRVARYTWRHVAERTLEGYESALGIGQARHVRRNIRPRVAWVSPWPPEQSGVANYSKRLVEELRRDVDVDIVVAEPLDTYAPVPRRVRLLPTTSLAWAREVRDYERVVYSMGNSSFHKHVFDALRERPGVILAHDVRLVGFYRWLAEQERPLEPWPHLAHYIRVMYGDRIPNDAFVQEPPSPDEQETQGLFMTHEVQRAAERLVVHSRYAADLFRLDRPADLPDGPPIDVVPHAFLPRRAPAVPRDHRDPVIVSFGVLSEVKGLATLIDGFALFALEHPTARLMLAGPAFPDELQRWRDYALDAGIGERVDVPGFVVPDEYERLLGCATLAVQLRSTSNGEASGAVADCLSAGAPTIVTGEGWASELPPGAVLGVPRDATPHALAEAMSTIVDEPRSARELAACGLEHARANDFRAVADRYLELLALG